MADRGRPAHEPTQHDRDTAKRLAALGCPHEDIARRLKISADTLVKYYREELDEGRIDANTSIAGSLFKQAKEGNTVAAMFWLKTRAGWRETNRTELTGADGGAVEVITKIENVIVDGKNASDSDT